ncbi:hypothetical protein BTA51_21540 [Hahella sp. CCB-MM4]|uniref:bifunctional tRNA (5-methylaminomethyl-2-thiouridine)(34)-methyltransferase MnmD/FAD-dependent 5-carboxymethylaminomethyl-2-thiouridine(34) oxidoreductase MnmC n=1 Tax=Hahella sp. (strain CCB-MM4) TaxID=1926491 RepID=UPI000B9B39A0|nr:bifunctional tRNA (5-methylaminomethyl-2-thiouridine)(34)-methyltransferase MnmD/FAD-dependent 5-carboxymethylaminomethyl-2-thiouridine(34) oxidoreductase MnmC [Hahella sp. CCB-MM4]OZG71235.1 hypothetical protein BTA51_21540 [Hahella sp. CCB-MM4]
MKPPGIKEACIDWSDDNTPVSDQYQDVYFSRLNGKAETEHVFINGNRLRERFQSLPAGSRFVIAETGFGSGLNFLVAWQIWSEFAPKDASLHFISVEKFPLSLVDMQKSHGVWPELSIHTEQLHRQLPPPVQGVHRCQFENDRVHLTLFYGDVLDWLQHMSFQADAWFLDGFSPKQNPDMWSEDLFTGIASHSGESTTFATFTAAGHIRRGLAANGFNVSKTEGFGHKRDMTVGVMGNYSAIPPARGLAKSSKITVVGSGLSGAMTASALARRGFQVTVLEQHDKPAPAASGNPQGALYIKLAVDWNPHTRIHLAHYLYAQRAYQNILELKNHIWSPCGVIQLAYNPKEEQRQHKFAENSDYPDTVVYPLSVSEASRLAKVELTQGGLYFPGGGWVNPQALCRHLLDHPNIHVQFNTQVSGHQFLNDHWQIVDSEGGIHQTDLLILSEGHSSKQDPLLQHLPFKSIRGQISVIPGRKDTCPDREQVSADREQASPGEQQACPGEEQASKATRYPLDKVLCGDGYALPAINHQVVFGASFHPNSESLEITSGDNQENLNKLRNIATELFDSVSPDQAEIQGRAAIRCALPDYLPVIGPVAGKASAETNADATPPKLFANTAYGSKGLAIAPLAAEIVADMIEAVPLPLEDELVRRLAPERFNKGN